MDLGFSRFDTLRAEVAPVPLDYLQLVASLATMQATSRTAAIEARLLTGTFAASHPVAALVTIFAAASGWAESTGVLGGSFHPEMAARLAGPVT